MQVIFLDRCWVVHIIIIIIQFSALVPVSFNPSPGFYPRPSAKESSDYMHFGFLLPLLGDSHWYYFSMNTQSIIFRNSFWLGQPGFLLIFSSLSFFILPTITRTVVVLRCKIFLISFSKLLHLFILLLLFFMWRCPWFNGYRRRKWTRRHEFKPWTRLIAFHMALILLRKVRMQLFSLLLWWNSRGDWVLQLWVRQLV